MNKSEVLQNMAIDRMIDNINVIASDVTDMKLDIVTIQNDIAELRQMIKERKERKNKGGKAATAD